MVFFSRWSCWKIENVMYPGKFSSKKIPACTCMFVFTDKSRRPISLDAHHHTSLSTAEFHFQCLHVHKNHHEWRIWKWWVNTNSKNVTIMNVHLLVCTMMVNVTWNCGIIIDRPLCAWEVGVIANDVNSNEWSFASVISVIFGFGGDYKQNFTNLLHIVLCHFRSKNC